MKFRYILPAILFFLSTVACFAQPDNYSAPELNWFTIETKHFRVNYHEGAERTARVVAKIAEEMYGPITSLYKHEPDEKVSFILKDISDYSNGAAYFFNNKIEIWTTPLDFELRGTHNWLRNVLAHEFTHIIQIQSALKWGRGLPAFTFQWFAYERERRNDVLYGYPNTLVSYPLPGVIVPPWMAEGTAQFMREEFHFEHWDTHRDMILRCYALADSMLTWDEMGAFGKTSLGNESVYNAGYNLIRYIAHKYGEDKVVAITREMSKTFVFTVDGAIANVLGKSGRELYAEWQAAMKAEYKKRIAPVLEKPVTGQIVATTGFANLNAAYAPDGKKIAYTSNKTSDYFGQSGIYLYDVATKADTVLHPGTHSTLAWTPDGKKIIYSKYNTPSTVGHLYLDLYEYDLVEKEEKQLTHNLRARNPSLSPDGKRIAFVHEADGSINIGMVDADGKNFRDVTAFKNGEQAFSPSWSPDGKKLLFGYAPRTQRCIAQINADGTGLEVLLQDEAADYRDGKYVQDGGSFVYASDKTGIFNLYRYDIAAKSNVQLTNLTGGAFMPAVAPNGDIAFSSYTVSGYKLAVLAAPAPVAAEGHGYLPAENITSAVTPAGKSEFDWERLRNFNDVDLPKPIAKPYKSIFSSMMFFPTLRIDEYNRENRGLALFKPGITMFSSDILERVELLFAALINVKGERDLYLNFTYRDQLPLFGGLGIFPTVQLEAFNVTRKTSANISLPLDTLPVGLSFNLLEFAVKAGHNIFDNKTKLELGYRHSRYTSTIESFRSAVYDMQVSARDNLYLIGNALTATLHYANILPTRDNEINPVGTKLSLSYDYEFNQFNKNNDYGIDPGTGILVPKYGQYNFHSLDAHLMKSIPALFPRHTLTVRLRGAAIFGEPVDEFFNFYAGGLAGMQGYTFYALGGNKLATAQVAYRFPLISSMDFRLGHILFDKLYLSVFADAGDAQMTQPEFALDKLKRDLGFELRVEAFSFAMYPTRIAFSGAYGLDSFTRTFNLEPVTYGHEWRWYFTMLFGFDLSDGAVRAPRGM
jgi:hypothetical protein